MQGRDGIVGVWYKTYMEEFELIFKGDMFLRVEIVTLWLLLLCHKKMSCNQNNHRFCKMKMDADYEGYNVYNIYNVF